VWEAIKQWYLDAPILVAPRWHMEFHVHINALNLVVEVMLAQNPIRNGDQLIIYTFRLSNNVKKNYTTTKLEALAMVYALHEFKHYLL
jgi:branched-subunit amino acid transport protein AzlD